MKHLIFFLLCLWSYDMMAQDMVTTDQYHSGLTVQTKMKIVAPTLWGNCDYFGGYEQYLVYKSSIDKNYYLLGFTQEGADPVMTLKIDDVNLNKQGTVCYLTYNGWTIRLYEPLD